MAETIESREDFMARRRELWRRRQELAARSDSDGSPALVQAAGARMSAAQSEGSVVPMGRNRRQIDNRLVDDDGGLPIPDASQSRLIARLAEMKASAAGQVGSSASLARKRRNRSILSFAVLCLIPTVLATIYMFAVASNQFHTEFKFAVRGQIAPSVSATPLSAMTSSGGSANLPDLADSYVVLDYLQSREFVEDLGKRVDLHAMYSNSAADFWYRLPDQVSIEKLTDYVKSMMTVTFDVYTGITTVQVRAFSPGDAKTLGDHVLSMTEQLVNRITERARKDQVKDSENEVTRAEDRLKEARAAIARFRAEGQQVDPTQVATAQQVNISQLEQELTKIKADLNQLQQTMAPTSPRVRVQQSRVDALERQITDEKMKVALRSRAGDAMAGQLERYESLTVERDFAQAAYVAAQQVLERARSDAERNMRFLAMVVHPREAQDSVYPLRLRYSFMTFLIMFALWSVSSLIFASLRDRSG